VVQLDWLGGEACVISTIQQAYKEHKQRLAAMNHPSMLKRFANIAKKVKIINDRLSELSDYPGSSCEY
jgi:hypothetical protein